VVRLALRSFPIKSDFYYEKFVILGGMKKRGPAPKFSDAHICVVMDFYRSYRRLGRKLLVKKLGVGEGSVRTILSQLKKRGLIKSSRGGHSLTEKGEKFLEELPKLTEIEAGDLTLGQHDVATVVRDASRFVGSGVELRDEAVKIGAVGATVLTFRRGTLQFPDGFEVKDKLAGFLTKTFGLRDGDVVIIGSGKDQISARLGAMAVAQRLLSLRPHE